MNSKFTFTSPESFKSEQSTIFAGQLLKATAAVRQTIRRSFGLSLDVSSDPIRVTHDGQSIGLGSFLVGSDEVEFSIGPKVSFKVLDLIEALRMSDYSGRISEFRIGRSLISTEQGYSDFTPAFLISILHSIAEYAARHTDITHHRRHEFCGWQIRGQPVISESLRLFSKGSVDGFVCNVYDNRAFQEYAEILCETTQDICRTLELWNRLILPIRSDADNMKKFIFTRLSHLRGSGFSSQLLLKVCRPPFPLGLREVLYSCMRYWQWRAQIMPSVKGTVPLGYWQFTVHLDNLFEEYVGQTWYNALSAKHEWISGKDFPYLVRKDGGDLQHAIRPDHIFRHVGGDSLIIVDAKYTAEIGKPDEIYQMLAYLNYQHSDKNPGQQLRGFLVYPGQELAFYPVTGFQHKLFCVTMPIPYSPTTPGLLEIVDTLTKESWEYQAIC